MCCYIKFNKIINKCYVYIFIVFLQLTHNLILFSSLTSAFLKKKKTHNISICSFH